MRFPAFCLLFLTSLPGFAGEDGHDLTPLPGEAAPALRLEALDGKPIELAALSGKLVLVNFWATWCPPCRREMPSLERLRQQMQGTPFAIVAVAVGEDADTVREFLPRFDPTPGFALLPDPRSRAAHAWKVGGLPSSFVVDAQGRLVYAAAGGRQFDHPEMLEKLRALLPQ